VFAELQLDKLPVRGKEGAHLAFPFNLPGGTIRVDQGEGFVQIDRDQLPGSCRDFIGVQSAVDISTRSKGITLVSLDAPLVELGRITDERPGPQHGRTWRTRVEPGSTVYAYLLNNYWHTNYKADQAGPLRYRFVLHPHSGFDPVAVRARSDDADHPLLVVQTTESAPLLRPPFVMKGDTVAVTALSGTDGGKGLTARLFNPRPVAADVTVDAGGRTVWQEGSAGKRVAGGHLTIPPLAVRTVHVTLTDGAAGTKTVRPPVRPRIENRR
jgi:hypothetical protein